MLKNFNQWNNKESSPLNEGVVSSLLQKALKLTKSQADDMLKSGFKGVSNISRKLFGASIDDVAKIEKGLSDVISVQKQPFIQELSKSARKALEKEADEITKKYLSGYHTSNVKEIEEARRLGNEYIKRVNGIKNTKDYIGGLKAKVDEIPTRKLRNEFDDAIKQAEDAIDDAAKTGNASRLDDARKFVEEPSKFFSGAGKGRAYSRTSYTGRSKFTGGAEPGADIADDVVNGLGSKGSDGFRKSVEENMEMQAAAMLVALGKKKPTSGLWKFFKKGLKWTLMTLATVYAGGVALEFLKRNQREEAKESIENGLEQIKEDFIENGISLTSIDMNKASFAEVFQIFFAGKEDDLPVDDASELNTMFKAGSTMTDFFAKTAQLCFEYANKYFRENEPTMLTRSKFYGFVHSLDKKVKVSSVIDSVLSAEGKVAVAMEETFYENGSPVSLDEYGFITYSNPNMKILLGPNEPVSVNDLVEECREFLKMFTSFTRKISNDFIQNQIIDVLKQNGKMTQEEFEERSSRIEKDLGEQLSEKESAFVAMSGMILSYNADKKPFSFFYTFSDSDLYMTTETISNMTGDYFDLRSYNQLSRLYLSLSSELSSVYDDMGKERSLYGIMEFSNFGSIMRSIMTMHALEKVCRMILSAQEAASAETFTRDEIKEYQKVLIQIQKKEGLPSTVTANGSLDADTEKAIGDYQEKLGLPKTGKPGDKSLSKFKDYLISIITSKKD